MKAGIDIASRRVEITTGHTVANAPTPRVTHGRHLRLSYYRPMPMPRRKDQKDPWGRVLTAAIVMVTLAVAFYLMVLTDINYPL